MKYKVPISVVMPCYNCGDFVADAVKSILAQSYSDFEFIIINDGSTDKSEEEISKFKDSRIKYIKLSKNKGNYVARNIGMKMSEGKYICVMDADDIAVENRLLVQFDYLERHSSVGLIGSKGEIMNTKNETTGQTIEKPICSADRLKTYFLVNNFTLHPSLMFRSHPLHKYNLFYNEKYKIASDYDFVVRWSEGLVVKNIDEVLIKYRIHNGQISSKKRLQQEYYADVIKLKQLKRLLPNPSQSIKHLYLKILKRTGLDQLEYQNAEKLLNKILEYNCDLGIYSNKCLYELFNYLLAMGVSKSN